MPRRIQRSRAKGWRLPAGCRYVGRPTAFGNPFTVVGAREAGYDGDDAALLRMCAYEHRRWLNGGGQGRYLSSDGRWYDRAVVLARLRDLAGWDLACWCGPDQPCHVDTLIELANRPAGEAS